jgi:hypothetical protein
VSTADDVAALLAGLTARGDAVSRERYHAFAERYLGPRAELDGAPARAAALILGEGFPAQRRSERQ